MNRKFSKRIIMLLSVIAIASCGNTTEKTGGLLKADLKDDQAIIEAGEKMEWVFGKNYTKWNPAQSDIDNAEKLISQCFEDQKRGTVNRLLNRKPEDYCKQFIGAVSSSGEKIIWINCFCKKEMSSFKNWKEGLIIVADGGNCFFNMKINVDKNTYTDVMVNGDA